METQQRMQQLRTPMDPLASRVSSFVLPLLSSSPSPQQQKGSTFLLLPLPLAAARALTVLRRLLLLATQAFISLFFMILSALSPAPPHPPPALAPTLPRVESGSLVGDTCVGRALAHVLSVASRLPVASRKYELVRGLAERLLDDNVRARAGAVNRAALAGAFSRTLRQLESASGGEWPGRELAVRAVRTGMRWWRPAAAASSLDEGFGGPAAEKLAAELLWLGQKMSECGAEREAVVQFGAAERLGSRELVAEPALQVSLLRLAVFLFKHANSREFEQSGGVARKEDNGVVAEQRMAMLRSWLPLLCRGSTGTDAPVLTSRERAEMVAVLEDLIDKLSWEQREQVLSLWLHHFAACPDTDWPNLESCYTRWYAESRKML
ncbi:hypothetical protein U9M48_021909, partial [Paspalum notatum var. saurae]